jgi:hypothetical protein
MPFKPVRTAEPVMIFERTSMESNRLASFA